MIRVPKISAHLETLTGDYRISTFSLVGDRLKFTSPHCT